jgi:TPR repeat protein
MDVSWLKSYDALIGRRTMKRKLLLVSFSTLLFVLPSVAQGSVAQINTANSGMQSLISRAQAGDAAAQFQLGRDYEDGKGVAQDDAKAVEWFRKAAEQKNPQGQNSLGAMYADGRGVEQNKQEAVRWYRMAAKNGLPEGFYNLAISYFNAEGVNENLHLAYVYMAIAAAKGEPEALQALRHISESLQNQLGEAKLELAQRYEEGEDVPEDYSAAAKIYEDVAETGSKSDSSHSTAEYKLCQYYASGKGVQQDQAAAKSHCEIAANEGDASAAIDLGHMAESGMAGNINLKEAESWFRKAANDAEEAAYLELGKLKLKDGSHQAMAEAYFWLHLANDAQLSEAQELLQKPIATLDKSETAFLRQQADQWQQMTPARRETEFKLELLPAAPVRPDQAEQSRPDERAKALVADFMGRRFNKVQVQLNSAMREKYPESKLLGIWFTLHSQFGDFQSIQQVREENLSSGSNFVVTCQFEHSIMDITLAFDEKGQVSGLFFIPPPQKKFEQKKA